MSEGLVLGPAYAPAFFAKVAFDIFTMKGQKDPWEDQRNIVRVLGLPITVSQLETLTHDEKIQLKRYARAAIIRASVEKAPKWVVKDPMSRGALSAVEPYTLQVLRGQERLPPAPDFARIAAIIARLRPAPAPERRPAPPLATTHAAVPLLVDRARRGQGAQEQKQRPATPQQARAQRAEAQQPRDVPTLEELIGETPATKAGAAVHDVIATVQAVQDAKKAQRRIERILKRSTEGGPPVSLSDTLNTVLGVGERAFGIYGGIQMAKAQADAARAMARAGAAPTNGTAALLAQLASQGTPGIAPAIYTPTPTQAGVPASVLSAITRFLEQGGAASLGSAAAGLLGSALAPTGGGSSGMILRPGDSVDTLYATRTANAAPSFFATQDASGRLRWYRSAGRPILWSGDLAAAKRVNRVASRAARRLGRGRSLRRSRR